MNNKEIKTAQKRWFETNKSSGEICGYPDCCIKAFGDDAPEVLEIRQPTSQDIQRFKAGCLNGEFTGFIPCAVHAQKIISGEITLESLIKNRNKDLPTFPLA